MLETSQAVAIAEQAQRPVVLLIGPAAELAREAKVPDGAALIELADLAAAVAWIDRQQIEPALVLIAQDRPGEIDEAELSALRRAAPLTRICGVLGSWCEGETRSGRPWLGVWRVMAHQWPQRGARQLEALGAGTPGICNLPVTATAEEQLLAEIDLLAGRVERRQRDGVSATIAVVAPAAEAGSALADACRALGYEAQAWRKPPVEGFGNCALVLWDTTARQASRADEVERLQRAANGAPIVAVLGFPRPEEIERARAAGVAAVISKPFLLADLDWQLERLTRSG